MLIGVVEQSRLLSLLHRLVAMFGVGEELSSFFAQVGACVLVAMLAWLSNFVVKGWILHWLEDWTGRTENKWDDYLTEHHVFERLSHLAPALILHLSASSVFPHSSSLQLMVRRFVMAYIVVVVGWVFLSLINMIVDILSASESARDKPLDSYAQLARGVVVLFAGIIVVAELLGRSPWALLGGLGAFAGILLLVFRDSILGFVASVQMTTLDLVRKGDWITIPKYNVDGNVIDFSLTTIKVQNWDKTISTVPAYVVISDTFKNWRGMTQAGARRIKRSIMLDMTSVRFLDNELLERLQKVHLLSSYLEKKLADIAEWNDEKDVDISSMVNGRRLTNLGTFRAYLDAYLRTNPEIIPTMTFLVRQLPPTPEGIGLEIYVFSKELRWQYYEGIIADIFDHVLAVLPEFELRVFQKPTAHDVRAIAEAVGVSQTQL